MLGQNLMSKAGIVKRKLAITSLNLTRSDATYQLIVIWDAIHLLIIIWHASSMQRFFFFRFQSKFVYEVKTYLQYQR